MVDVHILNPFLILLTKTYVLACSMFSLKTGLVTFIFIKCVLKNVHEVHKTEDNFRK